MQINGRDFWLEFARHSLNESAIVELSKLCDEAIGELNLSGEFTRKSSITSELSALCSRQNREFSPSISWIFSSQNDSSIGISAAVRTDLRQSSSLFRFHR
jgi:hypothetical protein